MEQEPPRDRKMLENIHCRTEEKEEALSETTRQGWVCGRNYWLSSGLLSCALTVTEFLAGPPTQPGARKGWHLSR